MRILHIIGTLNPAAGGPTESVRVLLSYGPIGYTGEVVTLDDPSAPYLSDIGFPVHALGPTNTKYGFNSKLLPWLRDNRHRFDGVVVNGLWQYCGYAAWRALAGNTPYVVFTHGMLDPYFKHAFPLKHIKKWLYWVPAEYWILRGAYRVLFTSKAEKRLAEQSFWLHRWNAYVVPYGASGPTGDPEVQKRAFFARCPEAKGKRYLLFLGRIHRKKGCDLLIDAFAKVAASDPDLYLVMAGPDQQLWSAKLKATAAAAGVGRPDLLAGDDYGRCEVGGVLWIRGVYSAFAPGELRDCRGGGAGVRQAGAAGRQGEYRGGDCGGWRGADGAGYRRRDVAAAAALDRDDSRRAEADGGAAPINASIADYDMRENAKAIIRLFGDCNGSDSSCC